MKKRYKIWLFFILFIILVIIWGITNTNTNDKWYEGNEGLIEKAREEITTLPEDHFDITIVGSVDIEQRCLVWFKAEDSYHQRSYFALEFKINNKDASLFQFVKVHDAIYIDLDTYLCYWELSENRSIYSFLIDNEKYAKLRLEYEDGTTEEKEIKNESFPLYTSNFNPVKYELYNESQELLD